MSVVPEHLRAAVAARAGNRCEYCHLPQQGQVARFPVDHVVPRSACGRTELANLALACPHCNALKWARTEHADPESGATTQLFNTRTQAWAEHFVWSVEDARVLLGKSAFGRATIACLQMNHPDMMAVRALLAELGLFPGND
jgi:HNH endonuclease